MTLNNEALKDTEISYKNMQRLIKKGEGKQIPARRRKAQEDHRIENVQDLLKGIFQTNL